MIKKMMTDEEIKSTFGVMVQLRTHIKESEYLERVRRQEKLSNYNIAAVIEEGVVKCVAGYRISECLAWGRFLYVDDLITDSDARSRDYGKQIMSWLSEEARKHQCAQLHLDSGVQRYAAHRFYFRERMDITCYHFAM